MRLSLVSESVIRVEGVSRAFGGQRVVDDLSFTVGRGTCFALTGPNGAGKSTTLKMVAGLLTPSSGQITVDGLDAGRQGRQLRTRLGVVPQDDLLDSDLSARDNLLFHARYCGIGFDAARRQCAALLSLLGLEGHAGAAVAHLSSGLRRRLVLARALLGDPAVLLLDEPTRGLDGDSRRFFLQHLRQLKEEGMTLLLVSHEREDLSALADTIAFLSRGRLGRIETLHRCAVGPVEGLRMVQGGRQR